MKKNVCAVLCVASACVMAFAGCTNENTVSGKTIEISEETAVVEEERERYMTIDGYTMAGGMLKVTMEDESVEETGAWGFILEEGKTIGDMFAAEGITEVTPYIMDSEDPENDVFEGWIEYKVTVTMDEEGFENSVYERVSGDTYYTTEELMEMPVPEYEVLYIAKWEAVPEEEYYKNYEIADDGKDLFLTMYANGGYMWMDGDDPYDFDLGVYAIETGETFGLMVDNEDNVSLEHDFAEFVGWTVYTGESIEWMEEEPAEVEETDIVVDLGNQGFGLIHNYEVVGESLSHDELMELVCEGTEYVALAMWE